MYTVISYIAITIALRSLEKLSTLLTPASYLSGSRLASDSAQAMHASR